MEACKFQIVVKSKDYVSKQLLNDGCGQGGENNYHMNHRLAFMKQPLLEEFLDAVASLVSTVSVTH